MSVMKKRELGRGFKNVVEGFILVWVFFSRVWNKDLEEVSLFGRWFREVKWGSGESDSR